MTDVLALSISESFLQIGLKASDAVNNKSRSYFLPKTSLQKSLEDFVNFHNVESIQNVIVHFRSPKFILNKQLGTAPAVLVTSGFEDWLNMNLPVREAHFHSQSSRVQTPLDRDLIFGVSERTSAHGEVVSALNIEELEFLASKLKLSKVENVCVCFLNSTKNSENLNKAVEFLRQNGLRVFTTPVGGEDEKARWWSSIIEAYLQPFYSESIDEIRGLLKLNENSNVMLSSSVGLTPVAEGFRTQSLFGEQSYIEKWCRDQIPENSQVTFLGLEEFYSFETSKKSQAHWMSPYGLIQMQTPPLHWHKQQPTGFFEKSFWGIPEISSDLAGYEPGPMCLGRGIRPTLLDLVFLTGTLKDAPVLSEFLNKKSIPRIKEALLNLCEDTKKDFTEKEVLENTLSLALNRLALELNPDLKQYFIGPLAGFFARRLQQLSSDLKPDVLNTDMQLPLHSLFEVIEKGGDLEN